MFLLLMMPAGCLYIFTSFFFFTVQQSFRQEVANRGKEFKETIFSFGSAEEEDYALWYVGNSVLWSEGSVCVGIYFLIFFFGSPFFFLPI